MSIMEALARWLRFAPEDFNRRVPYKPKHEWVRSADEDSGPVCFACGMPCVRGNLTDKCPGEVQA